MADIKKDVCESSSIEARIIDAMAEMTNPKRNASAHRYKYATLDQVLEIVRPALQANGLDVRQCCTVGEGGTLLLKTEAVAGDGKVLMDVRPLLSTSDPQAFGSFETYMRRYALLTAFSLAAEDDDGKAAKDASVQRKSPDPNAIEKGIKSLASISPMDEQTVRTVVAAIPDDNGKLEWLRASYTEAKEALNSGQPLARNYERTRRPARG